MSVAVISGSAGLIGSEAARHFAGLGYDIVGIDNNMRERLFGSDGSVDWQRAELRRTLKQSYRHCDFDIRDADAIDGLFSKYGSTITLVIHAAAQPSHDWAAREPKTDFSINAVGTLNLLEATRIHSPDACFIFMSTNKVYGDRPNTLPLVELDTRWEIAPGHPYAEGVDEDMSIDRSVHSLFGASKVAADVLVQEYGQYFGMKTVCFRGGCLTGPNHAGAQLHGFLAYLMKCAATGTPYTVYGYKGKQVRDNIHSRDLLRAFEAFSLAPKPAAVYNIGGGRQNSCSMLEAIALCEDIVGRPVDQVYSENNRTGDHIWWISNLRSFQQDYPSWRQEYTVQSTLNEIYDYNVERWRRKDVA
jgi:CDP-paratose 2-epimerase